MTPERTPGGLWVIYRGADGQRMERWPIDARGMLATGGYTADPPNGDSSLTATVAPGTAIPEPPDPPTDPSPAAVAVPDETPAEPPRRAKRKAA